MRAVCAEAAAARRVASARRCPTTTGRASAGVALDVDRRRAARAGRRPGGAAGRDRRRRRARRCATSSRTARSTTGCADDRCRPRRVLAGSGALPVLGMPGAVLLDLARGAGPSGAGSRGSPTAATRPTGGWSPRGEPRCAGRRPGRRRRRRGPARGRGRLGLRARRHARRGGPRAARSGRRSRPRASGCAALTPSDVIHRPAPDPVENGGQLVEARTPFCGRHAGDRENSRNSWPEPLVRLRPQGRRTSPTNPVRGDGDRTGEKIQHGGFARRAGPVTGSAGSERTDRSIGRHRTGQAEGLLMLIPSGAPHLISPRYWSP